MTPLPIDLAQPPVLVPFHRLRGLARRLWVSLKDGANSRNRDRATEPPMPLYWLHIQQCTPQHSKRWWKRTWLRWWE